MAMRQIHLELKKSHEIDELNRVLMRYYYYHHHYHYNYYFIFISPQ